MPKKKKMKDPKRITPQMQRVIHNTGGDLEELHYLAKKWGVSLRDVRYEAQRQGYE